MNRFLDAVTDPKQLSPLDLAFLGDCVYELFVRERLVTEANRPAGDLHAAKVRWVNADAQAAALERIAPLLNEEEEAVFRLWSLAPLLECRKYAASFQSAVPGSPRDSGAG